MIGCSAPANWWISTSHSWSILTGGLRSLHFALIYKNKLACFPIFPILHVLDDQDTLMSRSSFYSRKNASYLFTGGETPGENVVGKGKIICCRNNRPRASQPHN